MAADYSSPENVILSKTTTTISPLGSSIPTLKPSHFLNPTHSFSPQTPPFRPIVPLCRRPFWPIKVSYNGWRTPWGPLWAHWVSAMEDKHGMVWKKCGIWDAVMGSAVKVCRDEEVLLGVIERWCISTNTFVFPWGEATVTLEDMVVLGGFSVVGDGVWGDRGDEEDEVVLRLVEAHRRLSRETAAQKANHGLWMKEFIGKEETGIEHEAFLACWLSRFVFASFPFDVVSKRMFRMAVCLARGDQVALAPVVLASVYRDLSLLKSTMDAAAVMEEEREAEGDEEGSVLALTVWAPLQLVQVWIWERFVELRPKPVVLEPGNPRLARWHGVERNDVGNVRPIVQSAGDTFLWRPYTIAGDNLPQPGFYREAEEFVVVDKDLDVDIKAFARCLRVSELVGIDGIEMYSPHRVALQFGFDQDIPDHVPKLDVTPEFAWFNYTRPVKDQVLYIPSRHVEADVTLRYLKWQRESVMASQVAFEGVPRRRRCSKRAKRPVKIKKEEENASFELGLPPGFHKKYNEVTGREPPKNDESWRVEMMKITEWLDKGYRKDKENAVLVSKSQAEESLPVVTIKKEKVDAAYDLEAPPGFYKKYNQLASVDLGNDAENRVAEMLNTTQSLDNDYKRREENAAAGLKSQAQSPSSSTADNEANILLDYIPPSRESVSKSEAAMMISAELGKPPARNITGSAFPDAEIVGNVPGLSVDCSDVKSFVDRVSKLGEAISLLRKVADAKSLSRT